MKLHCIAMTDTNLADVRKEITQIQKIVQTAAGDLAVRIRTKAPKKSGKLISGIIPSPWEEKSAHPGKVVRQVYMDAAMNDTFVKYAKSGKRYYYPASQEFGFRLARRSTSAANPKQTKVPGRYFMNDTFVEYMPAFEENVKQFVDKVVDG